jgi:hypothetical protein
MATEAFPSVSDVGDNSTVFQGRASADNSDQQSLPKSLGLSPSFWKSVMTGLVRRVFSVDATMGYCYPKSSLARAMDGRINAVIHPMADPWTLGLNRPYAPSHGLMLP